MATVGGGIVDFFEAAAVHHVRAAVATTAPGVGALQVLEFVLERQLGLVGIVGAFWRHRGGSMGGSRKTQADGCLGEVYKVSQKSRDVWSCAVQVRADSERRTK